MKCPYCNKVGSGHNEGCPHYRAPSPEPIVSDAAIAEVRGARLEREREERGDTECPTCHAKLIVETQGGGVVVRKVANDAGLWFPTKVTWDEPGDIGQSNRHCVLTIPEAIARQTEVAAKAHNHVYKSNHDALMDFITIHWAWLE